MYRKLVFALLIFFLPTQLAYHFWPDTSLIFGIRVDYLAPAIYVSDILVGVIFILNLREFAGEVVKNKTLAGLLIGLVVFGLVNSILGVNFWVSIYKWLKIFEVLFVVFYIYFLVEDPMEKIKLPLAMGVLGSVFLGVWQVTAGRTIGGVWYWFGERSFNINTPGIALFDFWGKSYLRPYAFFPHPNVMAGVLVLAVCVFLAQKKVNWFLVFIATAGVVLTFSQSGWIAAFFVFAIYFFRKGVNMEKFGWLLPEVVVLSLVTPVAGILLDRRREELARAAGMIFSQSPIIGVGLGNFVMALSKLSSTLTSEIVWWLQPAHNIFLVVLVETGIAGLVIFFVGLWLLLKGNRGNLFGVMAVGVIVITGFFDHYWLTLQQGILMFGVIVGLIMKTGRVRIKSDGES